MKITKAGRTPMTNWKGHYGLLVSAAAAMLITAVLGTQAERGAAQPSPGTTAMYAYVGSFTTAQRKARGDGIHVYRADSATGAWTHVQHIGDLVNPSYLALSPDQRVLFSAHGDGDFATAFALDPKTGEAKLINRAATGGKNGARDAADPSAKILVSANH